MNTKLIMSLDQGTTSSRAVLFNHKGESVEIAQQDFTQIFPQAGWVEHNPIEIWESQISTAREVLKKADTLNFEVAAIGITNQRETTLVWDKNTGEPIYNAIVWQDRRTANFCDELRASERTEIIKEKTGLILDAYFSATKLKWILDNVEGARAKANNNELCFGTVDTWLIWKLTKGEKFITDASNASRTMLFNIHNLNWDQELLDVFDIPRNILPEVKESSQVYGETSEGLFNKKFQFQESQVISKRHYLDNYVPKKGW